MVPAHNLNWVEVEEMSSRAKASEQAEENRANEPTEDLGSLCMYMTCNRQSAAYTYIRNMQTRRCPPYDRYGGTDQVEPFVEGRLGRKRWYEGGASTHVYRQVTIRHHVGWPGRHGVVDGCISAVVGACNQGRRVGRTRGVREEDKNMELLGWEDDLGPEYKGCVGFG